jgi:nucleoside-diphosphate-sugar epimerase
MDQGDAGPARGTCLIVGCGYVGTRLAVRAAARGPVLALRRNPMAAPGNGIRSVGVDLDADPPAFPVPADLDSVVYLAPPSGPGGEDHRLARCLRALGEARPRVLLYFSTTGVYGDTGGAPVDEASPANPGEDRSRQRLDAERQVAAWCGPRGVRAVVFRVPAIYGPQRLALDRLRRGEPVLRREDSGPGNRIHVDDLVAACLAALDPPVVGVFNLTDGHPESTAAFTIRLASLTGLPAPREVAWAEAQSALSPGILAFLRESRRVETRRQHELGWAPALDPDQGLRASLREMGIPVSSGAR